MSPLKSTIHLIKSPQHRESPQQITAKIPLISQVVDAHMRSVDRFRVSNLHQDIKILRQFIIPQDLVAYAK